MQLVTAVAQVGRQVGCSVVAAEASGLALMFLSEHRAGVGQSGESVKRIQMVSVLPAFIRSSSSYVPFTLNLHAPQCLIHVAPVRERHFSSAASLIK